MAIVKAYHVDRRGHRINGSSSRVEKKPYVPKMVAALWVKLQVQMIVPNHQQIHISSGHCDSRYSGEKVSHPRALFCDEFRLLQERSEIGIAAFKGRRFDLARRQPLRVPDVC